MKNMSQIRLNWYLNKVNLKLTYNLKFEYNIFKGIYNCCSESSISFHNVIPDNIRKITKIVEKHKTSNIKKIIKEFLGI